LTKGNVPPTRVEDAETRILAFEVIVFRMVQGGTCHHGDSALL
jgi:hypothetical protein